MHTRIRLIHKYCTPELMQWIPPSLIGLLLLVIPVHAQSFASRIGVGVRVSGVDGVYLGARYGTLEILVSRGTLRDDGVTYHELRIGGQPHFYLWRRDRFKVYALGRLVLGFNIGDNRSIELGWIPIISGTLIAGAGVELPLHRRTQPRGLVMSLDVGSGIYRDPGGVLIVDLISWPQFGVGLHYYFY